MDHPRGVVIAERRWQTDRRIYPTTFWSALRAHGRRKNLRRAGEASHAYVDCPSQRAVVLLFFVLGASALDALCTLLFLQRGGQEANPFMSLVLNYGQTSFVGIKMALTGIGAWLLVAHHYFPMAYRGLLGLAGGYIGLLFLHAVLLLS
jgi:Domain of unknown function (DUF5658)